MDQISRKQAIKQGLTRYYTGKACKNGHLSPRLTSTTHCVECKRLDTKASGQRRLERARQGSTHFVTGRPCKNGHVGKRLRSTGGCVECHRLYVQQWRTDNPEQDKLIDRRGRLKNKVKLNAKSREYNRLNRKRLAEYNHRWWKANPDKWRQYESRPKRKIENILRVRLRCALKRGTKTGSAVRDLGFTIEQFKQYIEAQFTASMSWENHGKLWQLDHKRCLASFDLTDREQLLKACHFSNFQPLLKSDHHVKTLSDYQIIRKQQKE
jgi:hypothetical protein